MTLCKTDNAGALQIHSNSIAFFYICCIFIIILKNISGAAMNDKSNSKKQIHSFNIFRTIAISALVCTIALAVFILQQALVPGDKSALQSASVANTIKNTIDVNDNDEYVNLVSIDITNRSTTGKPVGATQTINVSFTPKYATDREIVYTSSDESVCTINEDGIVSYLSYGYATITAQSEKHPEISTQIELFCDGENPQSVSFLDLTFSNTSASELSAGTRNKPVFRDENGSIISFSALSVSSENENVLFVDDYGYLLAITKGSAQITVVHKISGYTKTFLLEINDPSVVIPESFIFKQSTVYINIGELLDPTDNILSALPEGADADVNMFCVISTKDGILTEIGDVFRASKLGETTISFIPYANPELSSDFKVVVQEPIPTYITIEGKNRIVAGDRYEYSAFFDKEYLQGVRWEVTAGRATISDSGILIANKLGNITVRATSLSNPEIYSELTVRVSLFSDFHMFVRKIIGHFSAFAVLGFGFAFVYFLLLRPRGLYLIFSSVSGFAVALLSEIFQLPVFVSGRVASWIDVMTDTCGVLFGIAVASILIGFYLLTTKCFFRKNFERTQRSISILNVKTLFLSSKNSLFDMREYRKEQTYQSDISDE